MLTEQEISAGTDSGCIELYYQPRVDAVTMKLTALEALLH